MPMMTKFRGAGAMMRGTTVSVMGAAIVTVSVMGAAIVAVAVQVSTAQAAASPTAAPPVAGKPAAAVPTAAPATASAAATASGGSSPDWRTVVHDFAAKQFNHPAWGFSHCERDYSLARELAAADHVKLDDDVLFAAAYLHDMAAFPPWAKATVDHADEAASVVDTVLTGTGFPMAKIESVRSAIRTHMFARDPVGPEAIYLHDADALDWLGAIGVARIIALVEPHGGDPTGPKAASMLEENLKQVPSRVVSPAGKARVGERKAELEQFLRQLKHESDDFRTL